MIIKPRTIPPDIFHLEILKHRLNLHHPAAPEVEETLSTKKAGWSGEQSLDYHLDYLKDTHYILHNLRLYDGHHFFQIDTVILFPSFILILEAKNMIGQISIHREKKEMRRDMEGFQDPVEQAERQKRLLEEWLWRQLRIRMHIDFLVVFTNRRCTLEFDSSDPRIYEKVIRASSLVDAMKKKKDNYQGKAFKKKELLRIGQALVGSHRDHVPDYMKRFNLSYSDLLKGVRCPSCGKYAMRRTKMKWVCPGCSRHSFLAHEQALREYAVLVAKTISNKEARDFLKVGSRHVVYRLLSAYCKGRSGSTKKAKFLLE
ncbi:nuclease-related domain-containing protein [Halobacillus faecis]|uniref:Nuclease n=1 Tax=Halobacillus faecis TaxID=360184 RepID=A0A511WRN3_9BACI|nr:nuclease-related domain-containing protein [Halobacillus faecis]GEN53819.1 nuclease [Halobacillus faecis]